MFDLVLKANNLNGLKYLNCNGVTFCNFHRKRLATKEMSALKSTKLSKDQIVVVSDKAKGSQVFY